MDLVEAQEQAEVYGDGGTEYPQGYEGMENQYPQAQYDEGYSVDNAEGYVAEGRYT